MIKLVIFDWNGVLIADTMAALRGGNAVIKAFGGTPVNIATYREQSIIPSTEYFINRGCKRDDIINNSQKIGEIFHKYYEELGLKVRTRRGARPLLKWLKRNSISSAILSNHTVVGIRAQLMRLKLQEYFLDIIASDQLDNFMKNSSKEKKLAKILNLSNMDHSEVLIVGDAPEEVELGKSAGITTVAITHGHYSTARLVKAGPNYLISSLQRLIGIIQKIK